MGEGERPGVKHQTGGFRHIFGAIDRIPKNRMTDRTHMDTNLMGPAGYDMYIEQSPVRIFLQDGPFGKRIAAFGINR